MTKKTCIEFARAVGPEDLRRGDFVAVLSITLEHLPQSALDGSFPCASPEPVRTQWLPWCGGEPLKVCAVALPFIFTKDAEGDFLALDIRRYALARLPKGYARVAWRALKEKAERDRKKKK
jgi:hypothetical protein